MENKIANKNSLEGIVSIDWDNKSALKTTSDILISVGKLAPGLIGTCLTYCTSFVPFIFSMAVFKTQLGLDKAGVYDSGAVEYGLTGLLITGGLYATVRLQEPAMNAGLKVFGYWVDFLKRKSKPNYSLK